MGVNVICIWEKHKFGEDPEWGVLWAKLCPPKFRDEELIPRTTAHNVLEKGSLKKWLHKNWAIKVDSNLIWLGSM